MLVLCRNERQLAKAERQRLVASLVARMRSGRSRSSSTRSKRPAAGSRRRPSRGTSASSGSRRRTTRSAGSASRCRTANGATDPRETLTPLLEQFGRRAVAAQNIVVVQSEIGSAPAIARALDRIEHPLVVGTLAGDDTCLVIARTRAARASSPPSWRSRSP